MEAFVASIPFSQQFESGCMPPANSSSGVVLLQRGSGPTSCLAATSSANDAPINASGSCGSDSAALNRWRVNATTLGLFLASTPSQCFHTNSALSQCSFSVAYSVYRSAEPSLHPPADAAAHPCAAGTPIHLGDHCSNAITLDVGAGTLVQPGCPGMCAARTGGGGALALAPCSSEAAQGWVARNATVRADVAGLAEVDGTRWGGAYVQPFD